MKNVTTHFLKASLGWAVCVFAVKGDYVNVCYHWITWKTCIQLPADSCQALCPRPWAALRPQHAVTGIPLPAEPQSERHIHPERQTRQWPGCFSPRRGRGDCSQDPGLLPFALCMCPRRIGVSGCLASQWDVWGLVGSLGNTWGSSQPRSGPPVLNGQIDRRVLGTEDW